MTSKTTGLKAMAPTDEVAAQIVEHHRVVLIVHPCGTTLW